MVVLRLQLVGFRCTCNTYLAVGLLGDCIACVGGVSGVGVACWHSCVYNSIPAVINTLRSTGPSAYWAHRFGQIRGLFTGWDPDSVWQ